MEETGLLEDKMKRIQDLENRVKFLEAQLAQYKKENCDLRKQLRAGAAPELSGELLPMVWNALSHRNQENLLKPVSTQEVYDAFVANCRYNNKVPASYNTVSRRLYELKQNGWAVLTWDNGKEMWQAVRR